MDRELRHELNTITGRVETERQRAELAEEDIRANVEQELAKLRGTLATLRDRMGDEVTQYLMTLDTLRNRVAGVEAQLVEKLAQRGAEGPRGAEPSGGWRHLWQLDSRARTVAFVCQRPVALAAAFGPRIVSDGLRVTCGHRVELPQGATFLELNTRLRDHSKEVHIESAPNRHRF